ncbi:Rrf2 family transcriptional regulator [Oceanobacter antarcticus]|jgi:Rrf2 family nitric oxide-sensitive transcriptional repressor|uniref:Rrf2 family transcriptional regulator n=1 Tax=Oceanobacter antarcticus TaxID=3133425 RepID=A0ABW8NKY3_9GAMM
MQLTRFTDYGLRILVYLCQTPANEKVSLSVLAHRFNMNHNHVNKVSQKLAGLGWIHSTRGKMGGITLAATARQLSIADIVRELELQLDPIDCGGIDCPMTGHCRLQGVLADAAAAFIQVLEQYCLEDISQQDIRWLLVPLPEHAS